MRIFDFITDPPVVSAILLHLDLPNRAEEESSGRVRVDGLEIGLVDCCRTPRLRGVGKSPAETATPTEPEPVFPFLAGTETLSRPWVASTRERTDRRGGGPAYPPSGAGARTEALR